MRLWTAPLELPEESGCGSYCTLDLQLHLPDDLAGAAGAAAKALRDPAGEACRSLVRAPGTTPPQQQRSPLGLPPGTFPGYPVVFFFSGFEVRAWAPHARPACPPPPRSGSAAPT